MRKAIVIIAAILLLAGCIHISLIPLLYGGLSLDALWYSTAGFSLILLAFINYLIASTQPMRTQTFLIGVVGNVLGAIVMALIFYFLRGPHVALLFVLLLVETILLVRLRITSGKTLATKLNI